MMYLLTVLIQKQQDLFLHIKTVVQQKQHSLHKDHFRFIDKNERQYWNLIELTLKKQNIIFLMRSVLKTAHLKPLRPIINMYISAFFITFVQMDHFEQVFKGRKENMS